MSMLRIAGECKVSRTWCISPWLEVFFVQVGLGRLVVWIPIGIPENERDGLGYLGVPQIRIPKHRAPKATISFTS